MVQGHGVKDCVIGCSDFRLRKYQNKWIDDNLGNADPISRPGGAKIVTGEKTREGALEEMFLLTHKHGVETIHLINHIDCAAYGSSKAFANVEAEIEFLSAELQRAATIITGRPEGAGLKVRLYIMRLDGTVINVDAEHKPGETHRALQSAS